MKPRILLVVAGGGALGACLRHLVNLEAPDRPGDFPWTTFGINVVGCFLLALLPASAAVRRNPLLPPLLGTGVLGGFTTLSAYSEQTRALYTDGHTGLAGLYLVGTFVVCLAAVTVADRLSTAAARREFDAEEGDL
ncbi:MAG: fluoride efflux transporter FluC [Nocardioides sp.]